ncbi:MAG: methyltransferase domain-containing protein [Candidatus Peribacteraceae bacterium]|nr:methyltransferase domain-containing protein [Candidatus Peribacteraceae bacterium]MDD5741902.1 methyltransferase domain-containing protein [Candidatus Peribacteraceae bacterium]
MMQAISAKESMTREQYKMHLKDYYDRQSAVYSATYTGEGRYPTGHHRLWISLAMIDAIEPKPQTVLDAGCGDARLIVELSKRGINATGFDISDGMIDVGRKILKEHDLPEDRIAIGDIYKIPVADNSLDLLIALGVLENLDHHDELFTEFRRVLKPKGRILISLDNQLFSLFSFNQYTIRFYKKLLESIDVPTEERNEVLREMASWFHIEDIEQIDRIIGDHQIQKDHVDIPVYNRLSVDPELRPFGFATERLRFYHVHPLPPRFEKKFPELFRGFAEKLETSDYDWRSSLLCNCMLVQAVKE